MDTQTLSYYEQNAADVARRYEAAGEGVRSLFPFVFQRGERVLEIGAAGLAAERVTGDRLAPISEEVAGMFATLDDPHAFLVHDVRFHRAVALASANPVIGALVEMVSSLVYERRKTTVERAKDLKESAEMHRRIYQSIRDRDPERARSEMGAHLDLARQAQATEEAEPAVKASDIVDSPSGT